MKHTAWAERGGARASLLLAGSAQRWGRQEAGAALRGTACVPVTAVPHILTLLAPLRARPAASMQPPPAAGALTGAAQQWAAHLV